MNDRILFDRFPELRARIPWVPLADLPTPLRRMPALEHAIGDVRLFVKHDDVTGLGYGGNKVRKFEFLLARAIESGATELATAGGWGSHHVLATAFFARQAGLRSRAYVFPQPPTEHVRRQLLAMAGCGAELVPCARPTAAIARLTLATSGRRGVFRISPGGSTPEGILGYVEAGLEIAEQSVPAPDAIVVALGSGGTAAGLAVGLALAGLPTEVIAVQITSELVANARRVAGLCRRTQKLLGVPELHPRFRVLRGYLGNGYGHPTPQGTEAKQRARNLEGLDLEDSYTAKAMAAFLDLASRADARGKTYVFLDTFSSRPLDSLVAAAGPDDLPPELRALF